MAKYNPFPTFGGKNGIAGITPVKLAPTQMRFPTARGPVRRAPEPDTLEKVAPLLPFLFDGIGSMFKGQQAKPMNREEYLKSIGADVEDPTKLQSARADAYTLFGPKEEKDGFGFDDIFDIAAASQLGRGASDFAKNTVALNRAKEQDRLTREGRRASFIQKQVSPDAFQFLNLQDTNKARTGVVDIRPGYFDKETGLTYIKDPDNKDANDYGFVVAGENWIDPAKLASSSGSTGIDIYKDPQYTELVKTNAEITARDQAVMGTLNVANKTIEMLDEGIKDPSKAPTTVVSSLMNMGNSALTNFDQIASLNGNRDPLTYFSTDETGGTLRGSGNNARELYIALKSGDEEQIERATANFENATGTDLRQLMGETAYANVATRANFLQLAYMAAAANGQTGRTLSDKDLAYHLQIVGFGSTQDPKILKDNLIRFVDQLVGGVDAEIQVAIPTGGLQRYNMNDETFQSIVTMYYNPLIGKDASGADVPQWLNYGAYTYKPFYERYKGVGAVDQWQSHTPTFYDRKTKSSVNSTSPVNPSIDLDKDLKEIENLY